MYTAADLSVVIPSYHSKDTILACLESLYHQSEAPGEIILVDSSDDDSLEIALQHYPAVRHYHFPHRTFPGPARNKGIELATGEIIGFTDADCIVAPDWTARIVSQHNAGYKIVGGAVEPGDPHSSVAWAGHLAEFREYLPDVPAHATMHVPTCNISYRRELLEEYGGFPNSYYPQEDLLFNYLLHRHGFSIWFDPAIRVRHFCRATWRSYLSHQHRIGRVTRVTLARIQMEGSQIARRPGLAWSLAPALGALKFLRVTAVTTRVLRWEAVKRPELLLMFVLGSIWWARGFAAGARTGLSGIRGVIDPQEDIFILLDQSDVKAQASDES